MIVNGRYGYTIDHYKGSEYGHGMFQTPGIIVDGGRMKTEPWLVYEGKDSIFRASQFFKLKKYSLSYFFAGKFKKNS